MCVPLSSTHVCREVVRCGSVRGSRGVTRWHSKEVLLATTGMSGVGAPRSGGKREKMGDKQPKRKTEVSKGKKKKKSKNMTACN